MIASLKSVLERAQAWPPEAQEELATIASEMDAAIKGLAYRASVDELAAIDGAERSGIADASEVEAAFAAFGRR